MMFKAYGDVLSPKEAAEALGVKKALIYHQIKEGKLHAVKVGSLLRIPKQYLNAFLKDNKI